MPREAQPVDAERLLKEYRKRPDPDLLNQIVSAHLHIAAIIARRFSGRGVEYDDLYQVASLALYKAIARFDPDRGIKFVSFVTPSMVGEVKNYFRDRSRAIRLPRGGLQLARDIERVREALVQQLKRQPTAEEIAEALGTTLEEVLEGLEMRNAAALLPLDTMPAEEDESAPLSTYLGVDESGYAAVEHHDLIERAMKTLDEKERTVIRMRFFEGLSQRETAERLGVSQMWVSRGERRALARLRQAADPNKDT